MFFVYAHSNDTYYTVEIINIRTVNAGHEP